MTKISLTKVLQIVAGITGIGIGGALLFTPVAFEASAGIDVGENISLLSELRAFGGSIFFGGTLVLSGAFVPALSEFSLVLSSLFYTSIGIGRCVGIVLDGMPAESLVLAMAAELVIGGLSMYALFAHRKRSQSTREVIASAA